jgi:PAS domain S-box-containing protein
MVVVNQAGDIVLLNLQAEKQFGYQRDELVGQQVTNIIPEGFAERLIADDLRSAADALAQQIGTGIELIALRKDGTEFPIEIMLSPLESADGILVTAAIRDISRRQAADSHLAHMEARYRGLLEAAPDAMVVVNQAGDIVLLNLQAEKQFGYVGTVMVVEDEAVVRDMTTQLLERAGYQVHAVEDGASALAAAKLAQPFDVLVTDVIMPSMSGIDLAERMMDEYPLIGVVMLSGYTAETLDLERVTARGALFVSKPITSTQLLKTVLQAVASRRAASDRM